MSKELKTGIISILIIALFVWGYNFMKNKSLYDKTRTFYAEYTNVQGLAPKSNITINGLKVGTVSEITFHPFSLSIMASGSAFLSSDLKHGCCATFSLANTLCSLACFEEESAWNCFSGWFGMVLYTSAH